MYKFGKAVALSRFGFFLSSFICFFIFSYCFRCCMICDSSFFISKTEFPFFSPFFSGEREWVRHELAPWGISLPPPSLSAQRVTLPVSPTSFFWTITDSGKEMSSYAFLLLPLRKKGRKKSSNFPRKNFLPSFRECPIIFIIPGGKGRVSPYANPLNSRLLPIFCPFLLLSLHNGSQAKQREAEAVPARIVSFFFFFSLSFFAHGGRKGGGSLFCEKWKWPSMPLLPLPPPSGWTLPGIENIAHKHEKWGGKPSCKFASFFKKKLFL